MIHAFAMIERLRALRTRFDRLDHAESLIGGSANRHAAPPALEPEVCTLNVAPDDPHRHRIGNHSSPAPTPFRGAAARKEHLCRPLPDRPSDTCRSARTSARNRATRAASPPAPRPAPPASATPVSISSRSRSTTIRRPSRAISDGGIRTRRMADPSASSRIVISRYAITPSRVGDQMLTVRQAMHARPVRIEPPERRIPGAELAPLARRHIREPRRRHRREPQQIERVPLPTGSRALRRRRSATSRAYRAIAVSSAASKTAAAHSPAPGPRSPARPGSARSRAPNPRPPRSSPAPRCPTGKFIPGRGASGNGKEPASYHTHPVCSPISQTSGALTHIAIQLSGASFRP
jgi:hypothetical protein